MKYIEIVAATGSTETISRIADKVKAFDFHIGVEDARGMCRTRLLVGDGQLQLTLDTLQNILGAQEFSRIVVMPIETSLPKPDEEERKEESSATTAREQLYEDIEKEAHLGPNFIVLVMLSTIVAAIGLIENNLAVIIGAMVIAPLLGPNLALSLGTALGDLHLIRQATQTNIVGILIAVVLSAVIGMFWPINLDSPELMMRTEAGLDSIALALASGAAAALSLTSGLSSVLVGVMVAVALLPPAATLGIMLGNGNIDLATGAGLLLAINVVCVNLSSKLVFLFKNIRPRTWLEKEKASRAMIVYVVVWIVTLILLMMALYARGSLLTVTGVGPG